MTPDREEKLIDDVAWMRGQLESYFTSVSPTLATKESVDSVSNRLTEHCESHKDNRNLLPVWIGIAISCVAGISGMVMSIIWKGGVK